MQFVTLHTPVGFNTRGDKSMPLSAKESEMNRTIRSLLEVLTGRITTLIGSAIGTTAAAFRATHHAELMAHLEDLAQKYDGEGKPQIAENLRQQASRMEVDDPGSDARTVMENMLGSTQDQSLLPDQTTEATCPSLPKPSKRRRRRPNSTSKDDVDE